MITNTLKVRHVVVALIGLIVLFSSWTYVPPGHRGIQTTLSGMNMEPIQEGFHFVNPLSSVTDYSVRNRAFTVRHTVEDKDTQTLTLSVTINWYPEPQELPKLIKENGPEYYAVVLEPAINECLKAEVAKYKVIDVVKSRPQIKNNFEEALKNWVGKYKINIKEVAVTEIDFSDEYDKAIEAKQVAEQSAAKAINVLTQSKTEAEMTVVKATAEANAKVEETRGKAKSRILEAEAEAESLRIRGEAQAAYNKMVAESLSLDLISLMWVEKWNGTMPQTMLGDKSTPMFAVQGNK